MQILWTLMPSISTLTSNWCLRHPKGANKGKYQPAL
jgi:hypothetical protein